MEECFTMSTMLLHCVKLGALKLKKISRISRAMNVLPLRSNIPRDVPPVSLLEICRLIPQLSLPL